MRAGLVKSKCELTKGYGDDEGQPYRQSRRSGYINNLVCPCGHPTQDSQHLLFECDRELQKLEQMKQAIATQTQGTQLQHTVQQLAPRDLLHAALGGSLPPRPGALRSNAGEAAEIMTSSAPLVHRFFEDTISIPFEKAF